MSRCTLLLLAALVLCVRSPSAIADAGGDSTAESDSFDLTVVVEAVEISGNDVTADKLIIRALPFSVGDRVRVGGSRFDSVRHKILALGFFHDVVVSLRRGSRRGLVVLEIQVEERGTVILERLHFGRTELVPWWVGIELTERNVLGSGIGVGGGVLVSGAPEREGAEEQWAAELRISDDNIGGSRWGAFGTLFHIDSSEAVASTAGELSRYTRSGLRLGPSFNVGALTRVYAGARVEQVDVDTGTTALVGGKSHVVALSLGFDRDTRPHPILPWTGTRLSLHAEVGAGGDYDFTSFLAQAAAWWPVVGKRHVLSAHLTSAAVFGDVPLFDRLYVGTFDRWLTPRELGLVLSTRESADLLGFDADEIRYGEYGGIFELQYSIRLFRGGRRIYGGDIFFGAGLWGLGANEELVIDGFLDAGVRLDTEVGIFELSIANGVGRVPL